MNKFISNILLIFGCMIMYATPSRAAIDYQQVEEIIIAAKLSIEEARRVGFEWRDSNSILEYAIVAAESAMSVEDMENALSLAQKALLQGEAAQLQAKIAVDVAPRFGVIIRKIREYDQEIAVAKSARKVADDAGFEWRDTTDLITKADVAARIGRIDEALHLAKRARFQGEAAQAQTIAQANAEPRF